MRQIPAAACVARFWAQPPKSGNALHCCRPSFAMVRTAVPPTQLHRTSVSLRATSVTITFRKRVFAGNPHHRRGFRCPKPPPEKHHEHRFAQHPLSKIQKADVRVLGGYLGKRRARIMSISRVLEAEMPAAKRPRRYMKRLRRQKSELQNVAAYGYGRTPPGATSPTRARVLCVGPRRCAVSGPGATSRSV